MANLEYIYRFKGSRDGAMVRVLASHQCGPDSILGTDVICICGLSLLLVLVLSQRGFSPGTPVFPSPQYKLIYLIFFFIFLAGVAKRGWRG